MFAEGKVINTNSDVKPVSYGDDSGLYVEFYHREVQNEQKSLAEGRPIYESKEYVKIMSVGDKTKQWDRPVKKVSDSRGPADKDRFPKQWQAFLNQGVQNVEGTPILEWPAITRADAMGLKAMNIHTIEQLAALGDHNLTWLGARSVRDKAKAWMEKAKTGVDALQWAKEKNDMQTQIEALKNQLDGLIKAGLTPQEATAPPAKRGRPAKVKYEQDVSSAMPASSR